MTDLLGIPSFFVDSEQLERTTQQYKITVLREAYCFIIKSISLKR